MDELSSKIIASIRSEPERWKDEEKPIFIGNDAAVDIYIRRDDDICVLLRHNRKTLLMKAMVSSKSRFVDLEDVDGIVDAYRFLVGEADHQIRAKILRKLG